jgi:hypothetical protein
MLFVVVQHARGFCYACPIQTYSGRGTLKKGCHPNEHAIAYTDGEDPTPLPNETLSKMSIPIVRSSTGIRPLPRAARIRFGRGQAIQYNVKAKDIGRVREDHVPLLVSYWKTELGTASGPRTQSDSDATDQVSSQIDTTRLVSISQRFSDTYTDMPKARVSSLFPVRGWDRPTRTRSSGLCTYAYKSNVGKLQRAQRSS